MASDHPEREESAAGSDDLFTGTDDGRSVVADGGQEIVDNDQPPLGASDAVDVRAWLKDFTYREAHSATVGFAPMFVGLVLLPLAPTAGTGLLWTSVALSFLVYIQPSLIHSQLRYVVKEPHYYIGANAIAAVLGIVFLGFAVAVTTVFTEIPLYRPAWWFLDLSWFEAGVVGAIIVLLHTIRAAIRVTRD